MPFRLRLIYILIAASGFVWGRAAGAETITVPPCGDTPGTTSGAYGGIVNLIVSGVIVNTPGNPSQDPFYDVDPNDSSVEVQPNPGSLRYDRVSEGTNLCDGSASSHRVSDVIVGAYPAFNSSNTYSVAVDLGSAAAESLSFGFADCGCFDNSGQWTVTIEAGATTTTSTTTTTTTTTTLPADTDGDGIPDAQEQCECLGTAPGSPVTAVGCSIDQVCPCAAPLGRVAWANHGEYVRCVKFAAKELVRRGVMTTGDTVAAGRAAAQS